jgi:hypothetical protein
MAPQPGLVNYCAAYISLYSKNSKKRQSLPDDIEAIGLS